MAIIQERSDAPFSRSTPYSMAPGDTFQGTISFGETISRPGGRTSINRGDLVSIELQAGMTYELSLEGRETGFTLDDPFLLVIDPNANVLEHNDDIDPPHNLDSFIEFTARTSGTYYIAIAGRDTGHYELHVTEGAVRPTPPRATHDEIAEYLTTSLFGYPVAFDAAPGGALEVDISDLTADGQQLARWALEAWSNVSGLSFRFVSGGDAHITFDDDESGAFAQITAVGSRIVSAHVNISTLWLHNYGISLDSYAFQAYLHEVGHALGLGHPGDYDGSATYGIDNEFLNDSRQATVMSYFDQHQNPHVDADYAFVTTPMIADIIAIRNLYGESTEHNPGDSVYGSNSNVDGYLGQLLALVAGEASDPIAFDGKEIAFTIFDTGGDDTFDFRTDSRDQRINLRPESSSDVFGQTGNLNIARGTLIENVVAGSGDDRIIGNSAANRLEGREGNDLLRSVSGDDTLVGNEGDDTLIGGPGDDRLSGGSGGDKLSGNEGNDTLWGGEENDTLWGGGGEDRLSGGANDDTLWGGEGEDTLFGRDGDDRLGGQDGNDFGWGGAGDDRLLGGEGDDQLSGGGGRDVLIGSTGRDTLSGDGGDDTLWGGAGDDLLSGGAGNDSLSGGVGRDILDYSESPAGIRASLAIGTADGGHATGDRFSGFEDIVGSVHDDYIAGNGGGNALSGGDGHDHLIGNAGNDSLSGGEGNDRLEGGAGVDVFIFAPRHGDDTVHGFADGEDVIDLRQLGLSGFSDLNLRSYAQDVTIDLSGQGGGSILLENFDAADLDQSDFLF